MGRTDDRCKTTKISTFFSSMSTYCFICQEDGLDVVALRNNRSAGVVDDLGLGSSPFLHRGSQLHMLHRKVQSVSCLQITNPNDQNKNLLDGTNVPPVVLYILYLSLSRSLQSLPKYATAFCLGLLCSMPCLWAPVCLLDNYCWRKKLIR